MYAPLYLIYAQVMIINTPPIPDINVLLDILVITL